MFADRAKIYIRSGKGGDGHVSFRHELYVPNGGPDGGDGGRGGDVIFEIDEGQNTLGDYRHRRKYIAEDGQEGGKKRCHGADGKDVVLKVPEGTVIMDAESGKVIADMSGENKRETILRGGKGGLGNLHFKSPTNRAPRQFTLGEPGQARSLRLELKVLADVGLLGYPNAGKSTFITAVSNARPKIADYPFTTMSPHLGVVRIEQENSFVIADIPGLIEGAAEGAGLGHEFLRHLERTKLLLHIIDAMPFDGEDPIEKAHALVRELGKYSDTLLAKPRWVVVNKLDLVPAEDREALVKKLRDALCPDGHPFFAISAATREGTKEVVMAIAQFLDEQRRAERLKAEAERNPRFANTDEAAEEPAAETASEEAAGDKADSE